MVFGIHIYIIIFGIEFESFIKIWKVDTEIKFTITINTNITINNIITITIYNITIIYIREGGGIAAITLVNELTTAAFGLYAWKDAYFWRMSFLLAGLLSRARTVNFL